MDASGNEPSESGAGKSAGPSTVKKVAEAALPLEVGSLALGEDGHIQHGREDSPLHFRFTACGLDFEADLAGKDAPLRLTAHLGKLPYTAQSPDGRRLARSVLAATDRLRRGQILLTENQDMILQGELTPPSPRTAVNVIATATALILDFKPYIDLMAEALNLHPPRPSEPKNAEGEEAESEDVAATVSSDEGATIAETADDEVAGDEAADDEAADNEAASKETGEDGDAAAKAAAVGET
ncbi:hypothetical protein [Pelagibius sp.]|uniref:hypothetical protein n=1 Tax=Pelagibius sp. TaxID=1931238 RepID=UPI003BB0C5CB